MASASYPAMLLLAAIVLALVVSPACVLATAAPLDVSNIPRYRYDASLLGPNAKQFAALTRPGRLHNLVVLFTASKGSGADCGHVCEYAESIINSAKYSYDAAAAAGQDVPLVHFAAVDFKDGKDLMQKLKLTHLPIIHIWPATIGTQKGKEPKSGKAFHQFTEIQLGPEGLLKHINYIVGSKIVYAEPVDYSRLIKLGLAVTGLGAIGYVFWPVFYRILSSRALWALASTSFIIIMHGGYMWVDIRKAPFSSHERDGSETFVGSGMQSQLGAEIYSTAAAVATAILAALIFIAAVPRMTSQDSSADGAGASSAMPTTTCTKKGVRAAAAAARAAQPVSGQRLQQREMLRNFVAGACLLTIVFSFSALVRIFSTKMAYPYRMFL